LEPLKTTYLADGLRHGDINDAEAKAIVEAIAACHADPAYEEAHFGAICLQGNDQAARIQQILLERLGPGVFEKRNLRCGNPYAFQGDERDVMFLSMVAAPNANNAPLTTKMYFGRRSTIVGVPPSAVPNFAKSMIVVARRGFSDAARRSIVSRG